MNTTETLLIEIGTEDLPARYVVPLAEALRDGIAGGLAKRGLALGTAHSYATPRRIALIVEAVAGQQPNQSVEFTGPALAAALKDGQPTPAALGFAKKCGVEYAELSEKNGKLFFARTQPGKATLDLLPEIFEETLKSMDELVPKRMRWGAGSETFVRPVQWLTALLGSTIVPLRRFGVEASRLTYGHRFHAPAAIRLATPADYQVALLPAKVWADIASRKAEIRRQIELEASKLGGKARITEDLLDEVTALVEWPVVISGQIEARFLELPPEVIVATVETNQRYFTVFDAAGKLLPAFITIANIESKDPAQIVAGNERVVRPRLTDALFFWQQDLKQPLEAYRDKLKAVTYQKELGTIFHKVERFADPDKMARIAEFWDRRTKEDGPGVDFEAVKRAAQLCKCDLVTKMVYEFPELQGLMGGYYAEKSGERAAVSAAIRDHYLPTQQGTPIPATKEGQLLALADKLDTLAGIFAIGQKPTASKDPLALRRVALGVLRILIEGGWPLDLWRLINSAVSWQPAGKRDQQTVDELYRFVLERLRAYCVGNEIDGRPITVEMFEAVSALNITQPLDFDARLRAIHAFWALPVAQSLAAAHKRVRNILRQAGDTAVTAIDPTLFSHAAETELHAAVKALPVGADYETQLTALAGLRDAVDAFFDMRTPAGEPVMVNDPDAAVRANRLALLRALDGACRAVADISCLPG